MRPGIFSEPHELLWTRHRVCRKGGFVRIAVCSVYRAGGNFTTEPLQQRFRLRMIGEAVNSDRKRRVRQDFNRVAGLEVALARCGNSGELPYGDNRTGSIAMKHQIDSTSPILADRAYYE